MLAGRAAPQTIHHAAVRKSEDGCSAPSPRTVMRAMAPCRSHGPTTSSCAPASSMALSRPTLSHGPSSSLGWCAGQSAHASAFSVPIPAQPTSAVVAPTVHLLWPFDGLSTQWVATTMPTPSAPRPSHTAPLTQDDALADTSKPCPTFFQDEWRSPTYVQVGGKGAAAAAQAAAGPALPSPCP